MNVVQLLMLAAGAYLVWRYFAGAPNAGAAGQTQTTLPPASTEPGLVNVKGLVADAARRAGVGPLLTFWEWNYYYQQVRGLPGPDPLAVGVDPAKRLSVDEWWALGSPAGLGWVQ